MKMAEYSEKSGMLTWFRKKGHIKQLWNDLLDDPGFISAGHFVVKLTDVVDDVISYGWPLEQADEALVDFFQVRAAQADTDEMTQTLKAETVQCGVFLAVQNIQVNRQQLITGSIHLAPFHYNQLESSSPSSIKMINCAQFKQNTNRFH